MSRAVASTKGKKKKADRLFSLWIRRGGVCQRCERAAHPRDPESGLVVKGTATVQLQCAHIASRRRFGSRWDPLNALCLCAGCHHWMTDYPVMFSVWFEDAFPEMFDYQLELMAKLEAGERLAAPNLDDVIELFTPTKEPPP